MFLTFDRGQGRLVLSRSVPSLGQSARLARSAQFAGERDCTRPTCFQHAQVLFVIAGRNSRWFDSKKKTEGQAYIWSEYLCSIVTNFPSAWILQSLWTPFVFQIFVLVFQVSVVDPTLPSHIREAHIKVGQNK